MSARWAPMLAGALMLILPSQALAQPPACRTIRALTNADGREFANLGFTIGSASLTLRSGSRAPDLEGPSECELRSEGDRRDIDCRWRLYALEHASDFYDNLLTRMRACIADAMPAAEIPTRTEGWRVLRRHQALVAAEFSQTSVSLDLVDATAPPGSGAEEPPIHYVRILVEFEQGD